MLSADIQDVHANDVEPSRPNIDYHLKRQLDERYEDHAYFVKVCFDHFVLWLELIGTRTQCGVRERVTNAKFEHTVVAIRA